MRPIIFLLAFCAVAPALVLAAGPAPGQAENWNEMYPEKQQILALQGNQQRGERAFEICQGCHRVGALGRSDGSYPRLAGQHASVLIKQIADVRSGRRSNPRMLPFADQHAVTAQEIADIARYLEALPVPADQGQGPGSALATGKTLYERDCATCHGAMAMGDAQRFYPRLAGQHFRYLLRSSRMIRDGERRNTNPAMVDVIRLYSDDDIGAVADYISRLPATQGR